MQFDEECNLRFKCCCLCSEFCYLMVGIKALVGCLGGEGWWRLGGVLGLRWLDGVGC